MQACFGPEISADRVERNHRFLEEALELVQACGAARETACNSWATSTVALPASPRRKSGA
jgi:hypothetical protein